MSVTVATGYHVEPYVPQDFVDICSRVPHLPSYINPLVVGLEHRRGGPAFTLFDGDVRIFCAGVWIDGTRGHAWVMLSPEAHQRPIPVVRSILRYLPTIVNRNKLVRVQAECVASHEDAVKLLNAIGFTEESFMPKYGHDGEDFRRFVFFPGETHASGT